MIEAMIATVRNPLGTFAWLDARPWRMADRWALVLVTAALSAILSWLAGRLLPGSAEAGGVLGVLARFPLSMAGVQVASAALGAFLLSEVGRVFGGTGRFPAALLAVGWVEAIMVVLQAAQLALTLVLPPLGALLGIATLMLAAYLVVAMTMAVHGFRNPFLVVLGILGTLIATSLLMSMAAATLGLMPG